MHFLSERDCWDHGPDSWLSSLAQAKDGLLLRHPLWHDGRWLLTHGMVGGSAVLGLPLEEVKLKYTTMYALAPLRKYLFLPILDLDSVMAMTFVWRSSAVPFRFGFDLNFSSLSNFVGPASWSLRADLASL